MHTTKTYLKLVALIAITFTFSALPVRQTAAADDDQYSFKVHNTTDAKITKLLASQDGKEYGNFDLGREGIAPGKTVTLNWDKSTNEKGCKWFLKAVFADGESSDAKKFDFCEEDLELEF
jgi:hypothetical protein